MSYDKPERKPQCPICGHYSDDMVGYLAHYRINHSEAAKKEKKNEQDS